jgi:hypothetical protein
MRYKFKTEAHKYYDCDFGTTVKGVRSTSVVMVLRSLNCIVNGDLHGFSQKEFSFFLFFFFSSSSSLSTHHMSDYIVQGWIRLTISSIACVAGGK